MATTLPVKNKPVTEAPVPRGGMMSPELPFFLSRLRGEIDQLWERYARDLFPGWSNNNWRWGVEVEDEPEAIVVRAEAPGFEPGDFDLQVRGNELILKACRKSEKKEKGHEEQRHQECYQAITLPSGIDPEKVTATYRNGVMTVTLPKTAEGKGRRIPVKGA